MIFDDSGHSKSAGLKLKSLSELVKSKTPYFFVVAAAFFAYQFYLLVNSFSAVNRIYEGVFDVSSTPSFWSVTWFSSEFIGEIGLVVRFLGACFLVAFLLVLLVKRKFVLSFLRKAILLEGAYYLFILPFIVYMLIRPYESTAAQLVSAEAALSYVLQILLISPAFLVLYRKLRKPELDAAEVRKWGAIGVVGFTFALWVKHFLLNLYALPISLADGVLLVGFLNSALTMSFRRDSLARSVPALHQRESDRFNSTLAGLGLILIGVYFLVYTAVALLNQSYLNFLELTEIWAISMPIAGLGLIQKQD